MSISRRNFIKGATAGVVGAAAVSMIGCASDAKSGQEVVNEDKKPVIPDSPVDGVYLTKVMGHEDWINVSTTLRDGAIAACSVLNHEESIGVGSYACNRIPQAIVENQSVNVPNVRGCSVSSIAIKNAVSEAIELSGYNLEDFSKEIPREIPDENITKECDVAVMGAGTAGLMLGARLASKGFKVILVEKKDIPGGTMPFTYSSLNTAGSDRHRAWDVEGSLAESPFNSSLENLTEYIRSNIDEEKDIYNKEAPFSQAIYKNSGDAVDWMLGIGVGFQPLGYYEGALQLGAGTVLSPGIYEGGAGYCAMFLADYISKHEGCEIIYNASVNNLITDETGVYRGVKAATFDTDTGTINYVVNARCVALCAGGFAKNQEMLAEYYPEHKDLYFNCGSGSTGEGIQLGIAAGAGIECMGRHLPAYPAAYYSKYELAFITYLTPGIMVNVDGLKCCNPNYHNHATMADIKMNPANGDTFYWIYDVSAAEKMKHYTDRGFDGYKTLFYREGDAEFFETIEDCAVTLGLPGLTEVVEQNNKEALAGELDEYGYESPFIETRTGVWATRIDPNFYLTTGGIMSDTACHVLREDGSIINGLYAAGDTCASPEEKDGKNYGEGFSMALFSGYALAETIDGEINAQ